MNLPAHLERQLATLPAGRLLVGFSGGLDSTALLHALWQSPAARARGLRAIHVDHGLHDDSAGWARHCIDACRQRDLPLAIASVRVTPDGDGIEAAARRARWQAFAVEATADDILVLAHHRNDQAETVLLRLLRGAGPTGLAAMEPFAQRDDGLRVWRPLLDIARADLHAWCAQFALEWIDDPSNAGTDLDRNFLRHEILPRLRERWPAIDRTLAQTAMRQRDAATLEREAGAVLLAGCTLPHDDAIAIAPLRTASRPLRWAALRLWLHRLGVPDVGAARLSRIDDELLAATPDATPRIDLGACVLRRYRGHVFALAPDADAAVDYRLSWDGRAPLVLPGGIGTLHIEPAAAAPLALVVASRTGGERLRRHDTGPRRSLKDLLQEAGVPPWQRARWPVIWLDGEVAGFADVIVSARLRSLLADAGARLRFEPR